MMTNFKASVSKKTEETEEKYSTEELLKEIIIRLNSIESSTRSMRFMMAAAWVIAIISFFMSVITIGSLPNM